MNELEYLVKLKRIIQEIGSLKVVLESVYFQYRFNETKTPHFNLSVSLQKKYSVPLDYYLIYGVKRFNFDSFYIDNTNPIINLPLWTVNYTDKYLTKVRNVSGYLTNVSGLFKVTNKKFLSRFSNDLSIFAYETIIHNFELFLSFILFEVIKELRLYTSKNDINYNNYIHSIISKENEMNSVEKVFEWENGKLTYIKSNTFSINNL